MIRTEEALIGAVATLLQTEVVVSLGKARRTVMRGATPVGREPAHGSTTKAGSMWRDPLDELIADLERIVPPEQPASSDFAAEFLDRQLAIARTAEDDEDASEAELDAAGRQLRRGLHRLLGREDEPDS